MLPIPTPACVTVVVGAVLAMAFGIYAASPFAVVLGGSTLLMVLVCFAITMPLGRRARRQRLEFAWWLGNDPGKSSNAVVPGAAFEVRCYIRHRGNMPFQLAGASPVSARDDLAPFAGRAEGLRLDARSRTEFSFQFRAPGVGRLVLHGLAVTVRGPLHLFQVPLYFPNPLVVKVLPMAAYRTRRVRRAPSELTMDRSGRSPLKRRGAGTDLHELRERAPGDPFRAIAWKASARRGKLLVKEVEQEVQQTRFVVADVSGSMRGGRVGARKLDFVIEAAAGEAQQALAAGDRVGVVLVDDRVIAYVAASDRAGQMLRIYDALLAATEIVDEDLTCVDDEVVVELVAKYLRYQEGVDFGSRKRGERWNRRALIRHVEKALRDDTSEDPRASSASAALLRRYCRVRGIRLPHRPDPNGTEKANGLAEAMQRVAQSRRDVAHILLISDFDSVASIEPIMRSIRLVRRRGHTLSVLIPDGPAFAGEATSDLKRDVGRVYAQNEALRVELATKRLRKVGAHVRKVGPKALEGLSR